MFLGSPTCYIFQCPTDSLRSPAPFSSLVPYAVDREPGLILLSPGGEFRFWDSIGLGLTGGEVTSSSDLELTEGETVTRFLRAEVNSHILLPCPLITFLISLLYSLLQLRLEDSFR